MRWLLSWRFVTGVMLLELGSLHGANAPQQFPQVQVRPLTLVGVWESAPIAAVGQLRNARPAGTQKVRKLPWPAPSNVNVIYWCRAELDVTAVVKGRRPAAEKEFLWGTAKPDCELYPSDDNRTMTRVWFIREEGKYIRPVVDGFGIYYISFYVPWDTTPTREPVQQLGELLLSPEARGATLAEFADGLFTSASTACVVLGRESCIKRLKELSKRGDPKLERAACDFVTSQFQVSCQP